MTRQPRAVLVEVPEAQAQPAWVAQAAPVQLVAAPARRVVEEAPE